MLNRLKLKSKKFGVQNFHKKPYEQNRATVHVDLYPSYHP